MNIAYLFCGHSRTWKECYDNFFKNVYSVAPGDIFIHTWDKVNAKTGSYWNGWSNLDKNITELSKKETEIELIYRMYNPKKMLVEIDKSWDIDPYPWAKDNKYKNHIQASGKFGVKYVMYAARKVFEMANSYHKYDRLFCTRLDINYLSKLDSEELKNTKLIVSCTQNSNLFKQDIFLHGTPEQIDLKTQFYHHIDKYWYDKNFIEIFLESALTAYMNDVGLECEESNLQFNIPRIVGPPTYFECKK